jgi:sporulation protein YlmC with PRC-barrel domain
MDSHDRFRFKVKVGHILAAGGALALMLAACSPAATVSPTALAPAATLAATEGLSLPTEAATSASTELATSAATEAATSASTELATSAATSAATEAATAATTAATSAATAAVTSEANATLAANTPLLIESNKLVGMAVQDSTGASLGQISDVLVDITGTVQAVVLNLGAAGTPAATEAATAAATMAATEAPTTAATSAAVTGTPAAAGNAVIVPWTDIKPDLTTQALIYQGSMTTLSSLPPYDAAKFDSGYVLRASGTSLPAQYDGLIRLGSQLSDLKLQTAANDQIGSVQNVILDLNAGKATYAAVDVSTFLAASNDVVLVPWSLFQLDKTDPASATSLTPIVRLSVTKTALQSAPKFDETSLSFWPTPAQPTWDNEIKLFWQTSGV